MAFDPAPSPAHSPSIVSTRCSDISPRMCAGRSWATWSSRVQKRSARPAAKRRPVGGHHDHLRPMRGGGRFGRRRRRHLRPLQRPGRSSPRSPAATSTSSRAKRSPRSRPTRSRSIRNPRVRSPRRGYDPYHRLNPAKSPFVLSMTERIGLPPILRPRAQGGRNLLRRIALLAIAAPRWVVSAAVLVTLAAGIFGVPVAKQPVLERVPGPGFGVCQGDATADRQVSPGRPADADHRHRI